ncbi:MAG: hypothetical protein BV458_05765 [Thermoplasmata archaeon M9B2D]|nr:MAG: hypothetical protein BV458_05765 [Thermoplasmata archaeon M9B2D]
MKWDKKIFFLYITITTFFMYAGRLLVPALSGNIEDGLKINHVQLGLGMTLFWLFYGLIQFPSGILVDEKGGKLVLNLSIFIFAFAFFLLSFLQNYVLFLLALILMGIGFGGFYNASLKLISIRFTKKRGKIFGIQSAIGSLAGISPVFILPFINEFGWRILVFLWAIISLILAMLFLRAGAERNSENQSKKEGIKNGIIILRDRKVILFLVFNIVMSFCWFGLISFLPLYLIEGKDINEAIAVMIFSLVFVAGLFIRPLFGYLSDYISKKTLILILLFLASFSCFLLAYATTSYMLAIGAMLVATVSAFAPIRSVYLLNRWPVKSRGSRMGMYTTLVIIISSLSPIIVGYSIEYSNYHTIFLAFSFVVLFAAFVTLFLKYVYPTLTIKL